MPLPRVYRPEPRTSGPVDWRAKKEEIIAGLNVVAEYEALGVTFVGSTAKSSGICPCYAIGRDTSNPDDVPSAAVNRFTGFYWDSGGSQEKLPFLDFAVRYGKFGSWLEAARHYAAKAEVEIGQVTRNGKGWILEEIYEYREADGRTRYGEFRYKKPNGKKETRQYPIRNGTWLRDVEHPMDGIEPLPFRLPELLASAEDEPVLVVAGPKDVLRAVAVGLVATTNHGGEGAARATWERFAGMMPFRDYYLIPDNDEAGRKHVLAVAAILYPRAKSVRVVQLPETPRGGDLSDWLDMGHDVLELGRLMHAAPLWTPESPDPFAETVAPGDATEKTTGHSGREYEFPLIVRGNTVERREIDWLMKDRIPYGFLTLFAGRTKVGKSFVTLAIVARLTTGGEVPLGGGECFEPGSCLIISEDSQEYVLVPRLLDAGADMTQVAFMGWEAMASFTLNDMEMLDDAYQAAGSPKFVVIDPPTNFLGGKDEHKNAEVRGVLMKVSVWAMKHRIAVVLITHCNKGTRKDMAAIDRIIGSIAWASTTRISHIFGPHPDEPDQSLWIPLGTNIGQKASGMAYRIAKQDDGRVIIEWVGSVDLDADDMFAGKKITKDVRAVDWLTERFREKRQWPSDEIKLAATEAGISKNALWSNSAQALPITKRPIIRADGARQWMWEANHGWPDTVPLPLSE